MSDLENLALDSIRIEPNLARAFAADWDYWLIDEYQDTSPVQVELLKHLVGDRPHYVVGDPQQSIYLFRGARSEVFTQKEVIEKERGLTRTKLRNWRSDPSLLLFFNDFFNKLSGQFSSMEPKTNPGVDQPLVAHFLKGQKSEDDFSVTEDAAIVHKVTELLDNGARPDEIAILSRDHKSLVELAGVLKSFGLPVHVHASGGFFERREVRDGLALLKFLLNPHDNRNLIELLRSPWVRVQDKELVESIAENKPEFFWKEVFQEREGIWVIDRLKSYLALIQQEGLSASFLKAMTELGLFDYCKLHDPTGRRESNLWKLYTQLRAQEKQPGFNAFDFIAQSKRALDPDEGGESDAVAAQEPNRINLMTIHKSKGLQFNHVIVPRIHKRPLYSGQGMDPYFVFDEEEKKWSVACTIGEEKKICGSLLTYKYNQKMKERERQESDRLLYVALTRAKKSVTLTWTPATSKESWSNKIGLDLSEGLHKHQDYSYEVSSGPWPVSAQDAVNENSLTPREKYLSSVESLNPVTFSVTSLLDANTPEKSQDFQKTEEEAISKERLAKPSEGVLLHKIFEILKYHPERDLKDLLERWFGHSPEPVVKAIENVLGSKEVPIKEILEKGEVEWGFQLLTKKGILEGQVDLWAELENEIWLVDYKSGSTYYSEKAFEQLNVYALAFESYDKPIKLAVIYPFSNVVKVREAKSLQETRNKFEL